MQHKKMAPNEILQICTTTMDYFLNIAYANEPFVNKQYTINKPRYIQRLLSDW